MCRSRIPARTSLPTFKCLVSPPAASGWRCHLPATLDITAPGSQRSSVNGGHLNDFVGVCVCLGGGGHGHGGRPPLGRITFDRL